ncbi:hypothetical protein FBU59_004691 [Linderina macrospora]|uniref:Uncharacterized protein n=1 Tax=Linderina macrospora TaxID=4868 RepID=A0ACC1J4Y8_9FUNG|nr:hypothetical protein FBU59_004691 [Linderina macrospora]
MFPGPSTIPTNFASGQINSPEALQQFQSKFWTSHMASIEDNMPDFKNHLLPLARIKKVMKSDPDVKVQMISAEAPILFSKACEIFITEITQRSWMNAEENKRRTLQRQDVSFAAQRSEMFDFLIDVVPREEYANKKNAAAAAAAVKEEPGAGAANQTPAAAPQTQQPVQSAVAPSQQPPQQPQQQQTPSVAELSQQVPQAAQAGQAVAQPGTPNQAQQPGAAQYYNDPTLQQYYAQHLVDVSGFQPVAAPPTATEEQRNAYYRQIEREQLQWLQHQGLQPGFGSPQSSAVNDAAPLSAQIQQRIAGSLPQDLAGMQTEADQNDQA